MAAGLGQVVRQFAGVTRGGRLLDLAVSIPVGVVVLYGACSLLRVAELEQVTKAVLGPLTRRWKAVRPIHR